MQSTKDGAVLDRCVTGLRSVALTRAKLATADHVQAALPEVA